MKANFWSAGSNFVPLQLTTVGNRVYFRNQDVGTGDELWVSDGDEQSTHLVKDIYPAHRALSEPLHR